MFAIVRKIKKRPRLDTVEDCVRMFRLAFRVAGCHNYRFSKSKSGRTILLPVNPGLRRYYEITVIFSIILYGQKVRYSIIDPEDYLSYIAVVAVYSITTLIAFASVMILSFTYVHSIEAAYSLRRADKEMKQLGIEISYMFWYIVGCCYLANILFVPLILYVSERSWQKKIFDVISLYYSVYIRGAYMSYAIFFLLVILARLKQLNKKLNELDDDDDVMSSVESRMKRTLANKHSPSFILDKVATIYANLIEGTNLLNKSYSLVFLINIIGNVIQATQAMMIIYAGNYKEIIIMEMLIFFLLNQGQVFVLALVTYFIENEAKNILTTLGHLNIFYFDQKLAFKKNTLLLQGLHNKVDSTVCGLFPLNGSIFFKQFSTCTTLFLLLLQYYQKSSKE